MRITAINEICWAGYSAQTPMGLAIPHKHPCSVAYACILTQGSFSMYEMLCSTRRRVLGGHRVTMCLLTEFS